MPIRVALGDDSLIVRAGIQLLLADVEDVDVVAVASDLPALRDACDRELPDVVVTDIRMPSDGEGDGILLALELRRRHPEMGVVVLSQFSAPEYALGLLDDGSDGRAYLLKEHLHNRAELTGAIRAVHEGGSMIDRKVVDALVHAHSAEHSPLTELTVREREVLGEIAQGKSNPAIAESLCITKRAVEKHVNAIFLKLGLADAHDVSKRVKATLMLLAESNVKRYELN